MRTFRQFEKAYGLYYGDRVLVMILRQSKVWTQCTLVGRVSGMAGQGVVYARVKTDSILPTPSI